MANYSYLSDGTKRSAVGDDGEGFVYLGSLVYRISGDSLSLESCSSPGGRLVAQGPDASTFLPYYFLTDHLGSVRAVVAESHDGDRVLRTTLEHNDYYPFGSRWEDPESLLSDNRYRYNGKEEQAFVGLPYIDYGARQLLAPFHIWLTQDPLAEKYYALSPYAFCAGNPILYVDLDGRGLREALKYINSSISASLTIGVQMGLSVEIGDKRTIGIYANLASADILRVDNGHVIDSRTTQRVQQSSEIGLGIISLSTEKTVTQEKPVCSNISEIDIVSSMAASVGLITAEHKEEEHLRVCGNRIVEHTTKEDNNIRTKDISFKASAILGAELSIDLETLVRGIMELFKE